MIKRYVQTRNRDHELVLTEDKGQNFLEWPRYVLASDYDALAAERDALAALVKERDAEVYHHGETAHQLREALARVKRLEDALRGVRDHQPAHCGCGVEGCIEVEEAWDEVRAALAGDKP